MVANYLRRGKLKPPGFSLSAKLILSMRITALIGFLIVCAAGTGFAQSRQGESPSSVDPGGRRDEYQIFRGRDSKKSKRSKQRLTFTDQKIQEYEDRQEANAKRAQAQAKEMEKPRYSDPSYFGHKSKPKKRAPGKKKFCKQCGISH
jgi:hypothetical protein